MLRCVRGNGSHAAVDRLQSFLRQRENMPQQHPAGGWYLQLDIHNYFNSIHRPTLYTMVCKRLQQAEKNGLLSKNALALRSLCHKLLAQPVLQMVRDHAAAAKIPPHKRLCNAALQCGLPVGNLTSQFFANVYLDALDQFIKHTLRVRHYVRYVDDFVLLGSSPAQLQAWQAEIELFLQQRLQLRVKSAGVLQPCCQGVDFLGYRVFAHYRRVRPRVVRHCVVKLRAWQSAHSQFVNVKPAEVARLHALLASYWGHFAHAHSVRLRRQIFDTLPWLQQYFDLASDASLQRKQQGRWLVLRHRAARSLLCA
jgi:RNA-directed DNA polymerase